jgi:hypothetical protein
LELEGSLIDIVQKDDDLALVSFPNVIKARLEDAPLDLLALRLRIRFPFREKLFHLPSLDPHKFRERIEEDRHGKPRDRGQGRLHKLKARKPTCLLVERQSTRAACPRSKLCNQPVRK